MQRVSALFATSTIAMLLMICSGVEAQPGPAADATANQKSPGAAQPARDPLSEHLFAPELVLQNADRLQVTSDQRSAIEAAVTTLRDQIPPLQQELRTELVSLGETIDTNSSDEQAVMAQLDTVLDKEREIKRMQIAVLVRVRNQLSPAQQGAVKKLRGQLAQQNRETQVRIQQKLRQVEKGVQQLAAQGRQPTEVVQTLQSFNALVKQGKVAEAEALVDKALAQLGAGQP